MREVITYIAYNGTEFNNRDECFEYELAAWKIFQSVKEKFSFLDENMNMIVAPESNDMEDWFNWLNIAFYACTYIKKYGSLTDDEVKLIKENTGICLYNEDFSCAIGLFKYNDKLMSWDRVDE